MLKKIHKNIQTIAIYMFPKRYALKLEQINYLNNTYIINLRLRDQTYVMSLDIQNLINKRALVDLMSPIDAYICGLTFSLNKNKLIFDEVDDLIRYFAIHNNGYIVNKLFDIGGFNLSNGNIELRIGSLIRNVIYKEFAAKPYLLNGLISYDAAQVGIASLDQTVGDLCQNQ